ncbi:MAG: MFS transporter [Chloroflexota bacterium]
MNLNPVDRIFRRQRITNLTLVVICQSFQPLAIGGVALFLPLIRADLNLTFSQGGTLAAASTLTYALMQIPAGFLTDRFGAKRLFVLGALGAMVLSFTLGLVTEYWQALINQAVSGFFRSLVFAPGLSLIAGWFPKERRATAMGLYLVGGFSGNVILDVLGPWLSARYDWRVPFIVFSLAGIAVALLFWRLGKESPRAAPRQEVNIRAVLQLFRSRLMWACGAIQYIRMAALQGIAFWLPSLLVDEKGLSLQITGLIIAMRALIIAPSNLIGGYASDRLHNPTLVIGVSLSVLMVTTALMVVLDNVVLVVVAIAVNSIFAQMYFGPLFALPVEVMGTRTAGTTAGFGNLYANLGAFTFAYLLGIMKDATGTFLSGFFLVAAVCGLGLVFTWLLAGMRRRALAAAVSAGDEG